MSYLYLRFLKRTFDILVSAVLLLLGIPVFLLIAAVIKIDSPGPAIYRQKRCTQKGKTFWIYKFRTMPDGIENGKGPVWGKEDDSRSTRVGLYLRLLHLDELLQLVNVLKGEMSLVGPRPERPYFVEQFKKTVPNYERRHKVKPGMTGWAQVNGFRGNTSVVERVKYDLFYIKNLSFLLDLKIILKTPLATNLRLSFSLKDTLEDYPALYDSDLLDEDSSEISKKTRLNIST